MPQLTSPVERNLVDYAPLALPKRYPRVVHVEGSIAYPVGGNVTSNPLRIDQSGLLVGLMLTFSGLNTTGATAPVVASGGAYNLIQKVILAVGGGVGRSIDLTAYQLNVAERIRDSDYVDDASLPVATSTANVFTFALYVPVAVRDGDMYGGYSDYLGSIYTGDPEVTVNLSIVWGNEATVFSTVNAAVITGTLTVTSFKLDTPSPDRDPMLLAAISWTHILLQEYDFRNLAAGPFTQILLPTAEPRVYLRHILLLQNNGVWTNGKMSTWDINFQDFVHFHDTIPEQVLLEQQLKRYNTALPAGTYVLDMAVADVRTQWTAVDKITLFKSVPMLTGAFTNPILQVVDESVVPSPLARKWIQKAAKANQHGNLNSLMA